MKNDARISIDLPCHPKTRKLIKRLGQAGAWNLVCLILWTASSRSDGDLKGMSAEDIELAANWQGDEGKFVTALSDLGFLDGQEGKYVVHDWHEHNPWAAGAKMRQAKARWNAVKGHHGEAEADRLVPDYAATRTASSDAISTLTGQPQQADSSAPSPSPSPSPSLRKPTASSSAKLPTCPVDQIIDLYHSILPGLPAVRLQDDSRKRALQKTWKWVLTSKRTDGTPRATTPEEALAWFRNYFERATENDFLMGRIPRTGAHAKWRCDIDFLMSDRGMKHVIEKTQSEETTA